MVSAFNGLAWNLKKDPNGRYMGLRITEHNTFAARTAEDRPGQDVIDFGSTAAMLGTQLAAVTGRFDYSSVFKFSQYYRAGPGSGVAKNGIFWADQGQDYKQRGHCDIGGSTKSAEVYRLTLTHPRTQAIAPIFLQARNEF